MADRVNWVFGPLEGGGGGGGLINHWQMPRLVGLSNFTLI